MPHINKHPQRHSPQIPFVFIAGIEGRATAYSDGSLFKSTPVGVLSQVLLSVSLKASCIRDSLSSYSIINKMKLQFILQISYRKHRPLSVSPSVFKLKSTIPRCSYPSALNRLQDIRADVFPPFFPETCHIIEIRVLQSVFLDKHSYHSSFERWI